MGSGTCHASRPGRCLYPSPFPTLHWDNASFLPHALISLFDKPGAYPRNAAPTSRYRYAMASSDDKTAAALSSIPCQPPSIFSIALLPNQYFITLRCLPHTSLAGPLLHTGTVRAMW